MNYFITQSKSILGKGPVIKKNIQKKTSCTKSLMILLNKTKNLKLLLTDDHRYLQVRNINPELKYKL